MNTVALRYALEVNRTHSITKAAQNLYMGQPNLSRAIRELEKDLGITLFERTTKGVAPTEKGRIFLEKAETILSQLDELEKQYRFDAADSVHLSVAFPRVTYASYAFTRFFKYPRCSAYPEYSLQRRSAYGRGAGCSPPRYGLCHRALSGALLWFFPQSGGGNQSGRRAPAGFPPAGTAQPLPPVILQKGSPAGGSDSLYGDRSRGLPGARFYAGGFSFLCPSHSGPRAEDLCL